MNGIEPVRDEFKTHSRATFDPTAKITQRIVKRTGDLVVVKVNRDVWAAALKAAHGEANRIEIISETEVVVRNKPVR